jgi:hypothetical protein
MKKVKQAPIRINLSFTQQEFECISQHANDLDLSLSGFIYANIKMSSTVSEFLGHEEIQKAYIKFCESVYDTLENSKQDEDDTYFEAIQQFQENTKEIDNTMYMAEKLRSFSIEWSKLRLLK